MVRQRAVPIRPAYVSAAQYEADTLARVVAYVVITARCYASAVLAMGLCLFVCLSVTSQSSTKTAKCRITQTTPYDTPGSLVF